MSQLNASQVRILQTLSTADGGMTRDELAEQGCSPTTDNLGTTTREGLAEHPESLGALGLVKIVPNSDSGEDRKTRFALTARGEKAATTHVTRVWEHDVKVPRKSLVSIGKKMRDTRTYSFEEFTESDLAEIRQNLPKEYQGVSDVSLKFQLVNLRKQGVFANPKDRAVKAAKATLKAFGRYGNVSKGLLPKAAEDMLIEMLPESVRGEYD